METKEFKFENEASIRTLMNKNSEISWFILEDVSNLFFPANVTIDINYYLDDEDLSIESNVNIINEYGVQRLSYIYNDDNFKNKRRWFLEDVLPVIRKGSKYSSDEANQREIMIQTKVKDIETVEGKIQKTNTTLSELKKKLNNHQSELKEILKTDIRQFSLLF